MQYAYLVGSLAFLGLWLVIYMYRRDLRREIVWASLVALPFGFIERMFVPLYWNPDSLFDLMRTYGFGIEGFIYAFSTAGVAAVVYEFLEKRKPVKIKRDKGPHLGAFLLFLAVYFWLEIFWPAKPMLDLSAALFLGAVFTVVLRRDLMRQVLASSFIFGILYFVFFAIINAGFNDLVSQFYTPQILGNFKILGVPLEEIIGAFAAGAFWSTLYEYTRAYREKLATLRRRGRL